MNRSRAWPSRPATSASPTTPTAASSPCTAGSCSASTARRSTSHSTRPRSRAGVDRRRRVAGRGARATWSRSTRGSSRPPPGARFPRTPQDQLRGAIEAVFRSWNGARAVAYRDRERIAHDLGTAVNVQAMVFGNRDDNSGTGVGFTRDPATGAQGAYGDFLINAQGEDVVAGIRNTAAAGGAEGSFPGDLPGADGYLRPARGALPRHVRHRVHHRSGQVVDAADPGGQAHRAGRAAMAVEMTKQRGWKISREEAVDAGQRRPPRPGPAPPVRHLRPDRHRHGTGRLPGGRRRQGLLHRRRCRRGGRAGREGHPGAQRDLARRRPRHDRLRGHPHLQGRPGQPRRRRGPGLGQAGGGRSRSGADQRIGHSAPVGSR